MPAQIRADQSRPLRRHILDAHPVNLGALENVHDIEELLDIQRFIGAHDHRRVGRVTTCLLYTSRCV